MADGTRLPTPRPAISPVNLRQQIVALRDQLNFLLDVDAINEDENEQVGYLEQIKECSLFVKYELKRMRKVRNLQVQFETRHPNIITIDDIESSADARLYGQALRNYFHDHNATTKIDEMIIYGSLRLEQLQDAELIFKVIRETPNLKKFTMGSGYSQIRSDGNDTLSAKMIASAFLESAAANKSIEEMVIGLLLPELDEMICLVMEQSQSLKVLRLHGNSFRGSGLPDLQRFQTNISKAFHNNRSLKVLQLVDWIFAHHTPFSMFANAIKLSQSIQRLEIEECNLDLASTKDLKDLITCRNPQMSTTASSFESLGLNCRSRFEYESQIETNNFQFILQDEQHQEATAQSSGKTLLCAATALREIRLECHQVDESKHISQLLSTFQNTTTTISVESILLYSMEPKHCAQVIQNLPTLRTLKRLGLNYVRVSNFSRRWYSGAEIAARQLVVDESLQSLVQAFRQNCSLEEITTDESVGLSLEQSNTVKLFGQRNERIQKWKNETTMPHDYYLYRALKSCLDYEFKFEIIMALLKMYWIENACENTPAI